MRAETTIGGASISFDGLTEEQKAKAKACKTPEEMLELASKEGYELSIDELEDAAGGSGGWKSPGSNPCNDECVPRNCGSYMA